MTQATTVRREGDTYQARVFWVKAVRLLDPSSPVIRVGFEVGPKGFDDVWVQYASGQGPGNQEGNPLVREHLQCKWHATPGTYGYTALADPVFVNANARSLLQRAHDAQLVHAPDGTSARFRLVTNWQVASEDNLRRMIHERSGALRLDRLFARTDRSAAGKIRKLWREHLGIGEVELHVLARTLAFSSSRESLDDLREQLDPWLGLAGLRRIPVSESCFVYDELVFQWLAQGRLDFDAATLRELCKRERLLGDTYSRPPTFGVKSFEHAFDRLEDRCTKVLDLVPSFDHRFIQHQEDWDGVLYPKLKAFLLKAARTHDRIRLVLDAHTTLAFAAGSVLDLKSGRVIELEQRTIGRKIWAPDDSENDPKWPTWEFKLELLHGNGDELAVAVGLTHDVSLAVKTYLERSCPCVGRLLLARPSTGTGTRFVAGGRHAFELAESLVSRLNVERGERSEALHVFVAAPNAFTFFLGQRHASLGRVTLYEYDFEGSRARSYEPALSLPS